MSTPPLATSAVFPAAAPGVSVEMLGADPSAAAPRVPLTRRLGRGPREPQPSRRDPRERGGAKLLAAFILTGLFFLAMPGTLIGVGNLLLIALQRAPQAPPPAWIQAHGQAQIFGWVGSFMLGISLFLLPRFRGRVLASLPAGWGVWLLWTGGVTLRWLTGVGDVPAHPYFVASACLELAAWALALALLMTPERCVGVFGSVLGYTGFCGLGITLLVNLMGTLQAAPDTAVYPPLLDREWVELALWAFILPLAVNYSARLVSGVLGLRPHRLGQRSINLFNLLALAAVALTVAVLLGAFAAADALALAMAATAVWGLRVFEPAAPAARPAPLEGVYRGFPVLIRIAFAWLLLGAVLGLLAHALPLLPGLGGASRHAVTVGFVATLIFAMGPRILPTFLDRKLFSAKLMALSLWTLTLGCALRVFSEAAAYGAPASWTWSWLPISAYLELAAVLLFVANLAITLLRAPQSVFPLTAADYPALYSQSRP